METGRKLFGSIKSLVLGRGITLKKKLKLRIVGKTLRIDNIYIGERLSYIWET